MDDFVTFARICPLVGFTTVDDETLGNEGDEKSQVFRITTMSRVTCTDSEMTSLR